MSGCLLSFYSLGRPSLMTAQTKHYSFIQSFERKEARILSFSEEKQNIISHIVNTTILCILSFIPLHQGVCSLLFHLLRLDALATVQTHLRNITTDLDGHASGSRHFQYQIQGMSVTEGSGGESHVQMPMRGGPTRHCLRKLLFGFLCEGLFGLPTSKQAQCALSDASIFDTSIFDTSIWMATPLPFSRRQVSDRV